MLRNFPTPSKNFPESGGAPSKHFFFCHRMPLILDARFSRTFRTFPPLFNICLFHPTPKNPHLQKPSLMSGPSKAFRQNDQMCKLEKKNQAVSCVDSRKESLTCLVKHAEKKNKSQICQPFFDTYKACIKRQADKLKADRIAARGGSRW